MAIWKKLFSKITFKDYPDTSTPLNASNLNKMTDAIDGIDDRVVELNSNLLYQPIKAVPQTFTIVDCINNTPLVTVASYVYSEHNVPSDYPSNMDATLYSIVTVRRITNSLSRLSIVSARNNGSPDFIEGYYNSNLADPFRWSESYANKIKGISNSYQMIMNKDTPIGTSYTFEKNGIIRIIARSTLAGSSIGIRTNMHAKGYIFLHTFAINEGYICSGDISVIKGHTITLETAENIQSLSVMFIPYSY